MEVDVGASKLLESGDVDNVDFGDDDEYRRMLLNPGSEIIVAKGDVAFVLAKSAHHAQDISRWDDIEDRDGALSETRQACLDSRFGSKNSGRITAQRALADAFAKDVIYSPSSHSSRTSGPLGSESVGQKEATRESEEGEIRSGFISDASQMVGHVIVAGGSADMSQFRETMSNLVSTEVPVLFLCPDLSRAQTVMDMTSHLSQTYAMVGSPVLTEDLKRAGLQSARRFICFADDELQRSTLERYVVDFTSISAHIATCNALDGDKGLVAEKSIVEFVFCKNAELLLPKAMYTGDDPELTNIVLVHDHQCAPFVAAGTVFSPTMVDYLMFQSYYSCYTLGVVANMASGQLQLLEVPEVLVGATFFDLVYCLTTGGTEGGLEDIMVPMALLRPRGHLDSALRYIYTMPKPETILTQGDQVYVMMRSPVEATLDTTRHSQVVQGLDQSDEGMDEAFRGAASVPAQAAADLAMTGTVP